MSPLTGWESFYVITGSAAAALTGLTFVVITLVAQSRVQSLGHGVAAFTSPTVVHFCVALLVSAILSAPWPTLSNAGPPLGLAGLAGVVYALLVARRLWRFSGYRPDREDWLCYAALPFAAYTILVVAAIMLPSSPTMALFGIAAVTLVLLFIGIRNAWDTVTYVAIAHSESQNESED